MKIFKPTLILDNTYDIKMSYILDNKYKLIIFDMNNTITDYYTNTISDEIENLIKNLKESNIKIYIITNSFNKKQVQEISNILNLKYIYKAFKPLPFAVKKVLKKENIKRNKVIIVGDHIFTDILTANLCNIDSILVNPLNKEEKFHSKLTRKIENLIIRKFKWKIASLRKIMVL